MIEHGAHYVSFGNIRSTWKYLSTKDEVTSSSYSWTSKSWEGSWGWFEDLIYDTDVNGGSEGF